MKRAELLKRVLEDCYCRLQPSPIHGIGVFAVRDIPKGRNPFKTTSKFSLTSSVRMTDNELNALPRGIAEVIRVLFVPDDGEVYVPACGLNVVYLDAFLNHSIKPNMRTKDGTVFNTLRKIRAGEELTVDYRTYGADGLLAAP